jgi:hypothetical protein
MKSPGAGSGLDDDDRIGKSYENPIAFQEGSARPGRKRPNHRPGPTTDLIEEFGIFLRVALFGSGSSHDPGAASPFEGAAMGRRVDANGAARHDNGAGFDRFRSEFSGEVFGFRRGLA